MLKQHVKTCVCTFTLVTLKLTFFWSTGLCLWVYEAWRVLTEHCELFGGCPAYFQVEPTQCSQPVLRGDPVSESSLIL